MLGHGTRSDMGCAGYEDATVVRGMVQVWGPKGVLG